MAAALEVVALIVEDDFAAGFACAACRSFAASAGPDAVMRDVDGLGGGGFLLTSSSSLSLLLSTRFLFCTFLAGFGGASTVAAAGLSPWPSLFSSAVFIRLVMKANMSLVTLVFARISTCLFRTSALMIRIAEESWVMESLARCTEIRMPIMVNSIGDTRVGLENDALYRLSLTRATKILKVSTTSLRNSDVTGVVICSHLSSCGAPGNVVSG